MLEVRLHGGLWKKASVSRREEWTRALDELNGGNEMLAVDTYATEDGAIEIVYPPTRDYHVRLYEGAFDRLAEVVLDAEEMKPLFAEYQRTIEELGNLHGSSATRGFETLDYAKRVVHDEAAEFLISSMKPIARVGMGDAKRLFTLIFLVESDLPEKLVLYHKFHL